MGMGSERGNGSKMGERMGRDWEKGKGAGYEDGKRGWGGGIGEGCERLRDLGEGLEDGKKENLGSMRGWR
jgi:hypothetical protein